MQGQWRWVAFQAVPARIPLGPLGDPETEIGRAVASLVSDDFKYMTGQTVVLTGGL